MIKTIGTHHLMKREEILAEIDRFNPDLVLIEFCNGRVSVIENPSLSKRNISLLGLIAFVVKKKAKKENLEYGGDMINAYRISKERGIPVGLIDRPLVETQVFFKSIPLKEKLILLNELRKLSSKKVTMDKVVIEATNLGDEKLKEFLDKFKETLPNLHYYLIQSRDKYMISKIKSYLYDYPEKNILCFVGKGHLDTINKSLVEKE